MMSKRRLPPADAGFDALRIRTGGPPAFKHLEMGTPLQQVVASEVVESEDELTIRLPERLNAGRNELIRVVFAAEVFDFAWTFDSQVLDSQTPEPAAARAEWRCQRRHCHQYPARPCFLDHSSREDPRPAPLYRRRSRPTATTSTTCWKSSMPS